MNAKHGYLIYIIHIAGVSVCLYIEFRQIFHIRTAFCGNVNTNAGESLKTSYDPLQTSYDRYKSLAINKNGLRLLTNMLRIYISYELKEHVVNLRKTPKMLMNTQSMLTNT